MQCPFHLDVRSLSMSDHIYPCPIMQPQHFDNTRQWSAINATSISRDVHVYPASCQKSRFDRNQLVLAQPQRQVIHHHERQGLPEEVTKVSFVRSKWGCAARRWALGCLGAGTLGIGQKGAGTNALCRMSRMKILILHLGSIQSRQRLRWRRVSWTIELSKDGPITLRGEMPNIGELCKYCCLLHTTNAWRAGHPMMLSRMRRWILCKSYGAGSDRHWHVSATIFWSSH